MTAASFDSAAYRRTHVYLDRGEAVPKHLFKTVGDKIAPFLSGADSSSLLDVGGAAGELVGYLSQRYPGLDATCLDNDQELLKRGAELFPESTFMQGDANDLKMLQDSQFDAVTMVGVLSIFDEFEPSLNECIRVTRKRGVILVVGQFNEYPVDVLSKWRYSDDHGKYNSGYNLFSKKSVSDFLISHSDVGVHDFEKFRLPFDLPRQDDPIRSWTELDRDGDRILVNGLQSEINLQLLTIQLN